MSEGLRLQPKRSEMCFAPSCVFPPIVHFTLNMDNENAGACSISHIISLFYFSVCLCANLANKLNAMKNLARDN